MKNQILKKIYRAVVYLRLSDEDGDNRESDSISNQRILIHSFLKSHPEIQVVKECVDDGYTGTNFNRPEFKRMMGLITRRKRICIIVKDLSRLGRDTIETQNYIEKIFPFLGVRFISINDFYDSSQKPSERKDTEAASVVRGIFDQRLEGKTYADIARDLNKKEVETPTVYFQRKGWTPEAKKSVKFWDGNLVKLILFNPVYAGLTVRGKTETRVPSKREYRYISREDWICVKGGHEAIVTEQELQKVQDMVQKDRKYHGSTPSSENIFAGLIRCGHCGRKMRIRTEYKEKPIYCKSVTTAPNASCYPKKSLKDYLARKQTCMEKTAAYQQKIQEIEAKILKGKEKQKEKSEGLQLFVKYSTFPPAKPV